MNQHPFMSRLAALALGATLSPMALAQQELLPADARTMDNGYSINLCNGQVGGAMANGWTENSLAWNPNLGNGGAFQCDKSRIQYSLTAAPGSTGKAMQIDVQSGPLQIHTGYEAPGGNRYTVRVKLMSNTAMEVVVRARQLQGPYFERNVRAVKLAANSWTTVELTVQKPAELPKERDLLMINVENKDEKAYRLWVDDASVTQTASQTSLYLKDVVVPKSFFGIHQHGSPSHDTQPYRMGTAVGAERFWDTTVQLPALFPTDAIGSGGAWDKFEARINSAKAKNTDLIMVVGGSMPGWASSDPGGQYGQNGGCDMYDGWKKGNGEAGSSAPPRDLTIWKTMVDTLVKKAAGRIKFWEIWNEPYQCVLLTSPTPQLVKDTGLQYDAAYLVKLAQVVHTSVKANTAHNLQVISPSFNAANLTALDRYLSLGGAKYQDITAMHNYCTEAYWNLAYGTNPSGDELAPPETCHGKWAITQNVRNVLARYTNANNVNLATLPVWDTESRVSLPISKIGIAPQFAARHLLMSFLTSVGRSYYYTWDNGSEIALSTKDPNTGTYQQNAVGKAYEVLSGWLSGATIKYVSPPSPTVPFMYVTIRRPGITVDEFIAWVPSGATTVAYIPSGLTKVTTLAGTSRAVVANEAINLTGSMVLVGR